MKTKAVLLLALCAGSAAFAGCTSFKPTADSWFPVFNHNGGDVVRKWEDDAGDMAKFTGKYFLQFDYDDPRTPSSLGRAWMGNLSDLQKFTDKTFLNFDYDDPFNR